MLESQGMTWVLSMAMNLTVGFIGFIIIAGLLHCWNKEVSITIATLGSFAMGFIYAINPLLDSFIGWSLFRFLDQMGIPESIYYFTFFFLIALAIMLSSLSAEGNKTSN